LRITGKPNLLKEINKKIVLNATISQGPIYKAKLAELTKISKPTIAKLVDSLVKDSLLKEVGYGKPSQLGGTKPLLYEFNADAAYVIGSQIRIEEIITAVTDCKARILFKVIKPIKIDYTVEQVVRIISDSFNEVIRNLHMEGKRLLGVGIAMHGIVDHERGILKFAPHFKRWPRDVEFAAMIKNITASPVLIDNDSRMQACGEKWFGAGGKARNLIAIETGPGISIGVMIDNKLYRGKNSVAGEIGHTTLNPYGPKCFCGNTGCFEVMASTDRLLKMAKEQLRYNKSSFVYEYSKGNPDSVNLDLIFDALNKEDRFAQKLISDIGYWLGLGIANIIANYDPDLIVIHGEYIKGGKFLLDKIFEVIKVHMLPEIPKKTDIIYSELGKDVGVIGAVSMVLKDLFLLSLPQVV